MEVMTTPAITLSGNPAKQPSSAPLKIAIAVFLFALVSIAWTGNYLLRQETRTQLDTLLALFEEVAKEPNKITTALASKGFSRCDDATLLAMRQALFDSAFTVEIGFLQGNHLVCTAGAGVLKEPILYSNPDYIGTQDAAIWIEPMFPLPLFDDRTMKAVVVGRDNFIMVMDPQRLDVLDPNAYVWEVMYRDQQGDFHLAGTAGIWDRAMKEFQSHGAFQHACSELVPNYCMAVETTIVEYLIRNRLTLSMCLWLAVSLGFAAWFLTRAHATLKRSTSYRVKQGVRNNYFYWLYQPIVDIKTGEVIGCEALARLKDEYGELKPDKFIGEIRKLGLSWTFTELMVKQVLYELEAEDELPEEFRVSLNIFPVDVERGNILRLSKLGDLQATRFQISLEVTEDEYLDAPAAQDYLHQISRAGYFLSIDDFGTGYSNLKNLSKLPFNQLKIDRTFVMDITTDGLKTSIIPHIMDIARKFRYSVIAEGVENPEQEALLKKAGVKLGQGWMYGPPMSAAKLAESYRRHQRPEIAC